MCAQGREQEAKGRHRFSVRPRTRKCASAKAPVSHGQTAPWCAVIAGPRPALGLAAVARVARVERPETERRQEPPPERPVDGAGAVGRKEVLRQGHRENLVRPQGRVGPRLADDVVEILPGRIPEQLVESPGDVPGLRPRDRAARAFSPASRSSRAAAFSTACQSASTSTGRPVPRSHRLAVATTSIHVSGRPGALPRLEKPVRPNGFRNGFPRGTRRGWSGPSREEARAEWDCGASGRTSRRRG